MRDVLPKVSQVIRGSAATCLRVSLVFALYLSCEIPLKQPVLCSLVFSKFE